MSLIANTSLNAALQAKVDSVTATCPSLDEWLSDELSEEHQRMYATLIQMRAEAENEQFPVDFDMLWTEIGFTRKDNAKRLLERICVADLDFFSVLLKEEREIGATQREEIHLTVDAAQKFALKADTVRGNAIADFFIQVLKVVQEYHLLSLHFDMRRQVAETTEKTLMSNITKGKKLFYIGDLGVINGKRRLKAGVTDDGHTRFAQHKRAFPNGFILIHVTEHNDNRELERHFKSYPEVASKRESITCGEETFTECFNVEGHMTIAKYRKIVKFLAKGISSDVARARAHEERIKELEARMKESEVDSQKQRTRQMEIELEMMKFRSVSQATISNDETESQQSIDEHEADNDPFGTWLDTVILRAPNKRIHFHRFKKAYRRYTNKDQTSLKSATIANQLTVRGFTVSRSKEAGHRDTNCCDSPNRYVVGADIKGWNKDS